MKHALLFVLSAMLCAPAGATGTGVSPLVGQWTLDTSRLPMPPEARPKRVAITFSQATQERLSMAVDIVYANASEVHSVGVAALDGTPVAVQGSPEADIAAMRRPEANVLVVVLGKTGGPASTRVYTVTPDGRHLVETVTAYGESGRPTMKTHYFSRAS